MKHQKTANFEGPINAALACLLALTVSWSPGALAEEQIDVEAIARNLEDYGKRLSVLRSNIDRSRFDPLEQTDRLDYQPETIIRFVSSDIAFQPYEGALRGPAGTLQSRGGNSLDQSMLLAYMLKSAGYDARIARAELSDDDALGLLMTTANGRIPQSLDYLADAAKQAGLTPAAATSDSHGLQTTRLYENAVKTAKELQAALDSAGIPLQSRDVTKDLLPQVKPYFWVQHRLGTNAAWLDAHPAFGGAEGPQGLEPLETFEESIPSKYHHVFTISAWIEQWKAGSIVRHRIMKPWTSPVANLIGVALRFRNAPSGLNNETAGDLGEALQKTTLFIPMFNEAMAPGAQAFDLKGRTVDLAALGGSGSAGIFQTIGDKFESATTGVADREDGKPTLALHSMYLEFTFTSPSGESDTRRRYLVAPRSNYDDDDAVRWLLITDHSYMVAPGNHPLDMLADSNLATNIQGLDWLEFTIRKSFEPDQKIPLPEEMPADLPPLFQHWTMEQQPQADPSVIHFRAVPALLGIRRGYRDAHTAFTAVDVVINRVEHLRKTESGLTTAPQAALRAGVWDTVLESVPARLTQRENRSISSTPRVFELAKQQGIETVVFKPGDPDRVEQIGIGEKAARFVRRDLERGYAVVIPARLPEGAPMAGWWRVRAETGETLGMTGDGYGSEVMEYLMDLVGTAKGLVDALNSILACQKEKSMAERLCCLLTAHADNVLGLGFGAFMGEAFGTAAATVFEIQNTETQWMTGGQGLLPSAGPMDCSSIPTDW